MFKRMIALIKKELQTLLRDKQTRAILIAPVLIQVLIFPFAATLDVTNASIAIFNQDGGPASIELTQRLAKTRSFSRVLLLDSSQAIASTIDEQKALLVVHFPYNFSAHLAQGESTSIQILLDGRHSNSAQIAANYIQQIVANYQRELAPRRSLTGQSEMVVRNWYNPNLNYKWFIVPSLIAMIVTIGVMIVTSLSVAREREQGTLEQLMVSPLGTLQIFIGKAIPAQLVAIFQGSIILLVGIFLYRIPFTGSLILFYCSMVIYTLSLVGFGLLISSISATQQQAFIGVFVFMMPCILLSGYISPVENMPLWLQEVTWINPIRHFTEITKQIYLKDAGMMTILGNLWPLLVITVMTSSIAYFLFRRNIT